MVVFKLHSKYLRGKCKFKKRLTELSFFQDEMLITELKFKNHLNFQFRFKVVF